MYSNYLRNIKPKWQSCQNSDSLWNINCYVAQLLFSVCTNKWSKCEKYIRIKTNILHELICLMNIRLRYNSIKNKLTKHNESKVLKTHNLNTIKFYRHWRTVINLLGSINTFGQDSRTQSSFSIELVALSSLQFRLSRIYSKNR